MTTREEAILWLSSFEKNKEPMTLIPKQLLRLMHEALTEQPEIVRCKDCKHGKQLFVDYISCQISEENESGCHVMHKPDWFCADGE